MNKIQLNTVIESLQSFKQLEPSVMQAVRSAVRHLFASRITQLERPKSGIETTEPRQCRAQFRYGIRNWNLRLHFGSKNLQHLTKCGLCGVRLTRPRLAKTPSFCKCYFSGHIAGLHKNTVQCVTRVLPPMVPLPSAPHQTQYVGVCRFGSRRFLTVLSPPLVPRLYCREGRGYMFLRNLIHICQIGKLCCLSVGLLPLSSGFLRNADKIFQQFTVTFLKCVPRLPGFNLNWIIDNCLNSFVDLLSPSRQTD